MNLYNQLFGMNPRAEILLNILGLSMSSTGRLRDVYVEKNPFVKVSDRYRIILFTRNGGPNRDCWEFEGCIDGKHDPLCIVSVCKCLREHPCYVRDYDHDLVDRTYASFVFSVPRHHFELVEHIYNITEDHQPPMEKFQKLLQKMESGDMSDPDVRKAVKIGQSVYSKVSKALEKPK